MTVETIDYALWEQYLADCSAQGVSASPKDYQIWLQEQGYDS